MARIEVPKITKELRLGEYAPEMDEAVIDVWVNPPRGLMQELDELRATVQALSGRLERLAEGVDVNAAGPDAQMEEARRIGEEINRCGEQLEAWAAVMWSQGQDAERHWTEEEVRELVERSVETDPNLWPWLLNRTRRMISEHRHGLKKG